MTPLCISASYISVREGGTWGQMSCGRLWCGNAKNMSAIKKTVGLLDWESGLKYRGGFFNSVKCQFNLQDVWSEMCANLQGNVFALVPNRLQKARLSMVEVQQLCPHTVVDIKKVVGVCPSVLHHLLRQRATGVKVREQSELPQLQINSFIHFTSSFTRNLKYFVGIIKDKVMFIPNPPVSQLVSFVWGHIAEVREEVV